METKNDNGLYVVKGDHCALGLYLGKEVMSWFPVDSRLFNWNVEESYDTYVGLEHYYGALGLLAAIAATGNQSAIDEIADSLRYVMRIENEVKVVRHYLTTYATLIKIVQRRIFITDDKHLEFIIPEADLKIRFFENRRTPAILPEFYNAFDYRCFAVLLVAALQRLKANSDYKSEYEKAHELVSQVHEGKEVKDGLVSYWGVVKDFPISWKD